eukprot:scaffold28201_cov56-Cyclotella_meneghiniana.AAC.2
MAEPTHYDILGIPRNADQLTIRKAYLRSSLSCHPDKNPNDEAYAKSQFVRVGEAYRVLKDPACRAAYDRELLAAGRCRERTNRANNRSSQQQHHRRQRNNNHQANNDDTGATDDTTQQSSEAEFQSFMDMFDQTVAGMSPEEVNRAMGAAAVVGSVLGSIVGARIAGKGGATHSLLSSAASMVGSAMASQAAASLIQTVHQDSTQRVLEKEDREAAIARGEYVTHPTPGENRERLMKDAVSAVQKMVGAAAAFAAPMMQDDTTTPYSTRQSHDNDGRRTNNNSQYYRRNMSFGNNNNGNVNVRFSFGNGSARSGSTRR